jgi:hypothetical protein
MNDPGFHVLDEGEVCRILDEAAFIGCHPKPLAQKLVLEALLAQVGDHHAADEVIDLAGAADVEPVKGFAILVDARPGNIPHHILPGPYTVRCLEGYAALFWRDSHALRVEWPFPQNDILGSIRTACARWNSPSPIHPGGVQFPWGQSSKSHDDAAEQAAYLFVSGFGGAFAALAAGRLEEAGVEVVGIARTRWLFDAPEP